VLQVEPMETFLKLLRQSLSRFPSNSERYVVAFSGGLDSTVLLAAMQRLESGVTVRAAHIDHGLQTDSYKWEAHCRETASALGVEYVSSKLLIESQSGDSLEALAREARYRALQDLLAPGEILLTAHHADDQLETLLLRLLRGSGVKGMRGISSFHRFGNGYLGRPLLHMTRRELQGMGVEWELEWLDDPMNLDERFDRNFIRKKVLPQVTTRWPSGGKTAVRAARQMADAQEILDGVAESDSSGILHPDRISQAALLELSASRQRNVLRHLIGRAGLPIPDSVQMDELLKSLQVRRIDAETQVQWPGGEGRIYRGVLHLFAPFGMGSRDNYIGELTKTQPWSGPEGRISLVSTTGQGLPDIWVKKGLSVRFRVGGECFKPPSYNHSRSLKKWFQETGVLPWLRGRVPLLYRDEQLVAVGDLWVSNVAKDAQENKQKWQISWTNHPPMT
jgi:tRNA(Ile)-lysidine synthase